MTNNLTWDTHCANDLVPQCVTVCPLISLANLDHNSVFFQVKVGGTKQKFKLVGFFWRFHLIILIRLCDHILSRLLKQSVYIFENFVLFLSHIN